MNIYVLPMDPMARFERRAVHRRSRQVRRRNRTLPFIFVEPTEPELPRYGAGVPMKVKKGPVVSA